MLAMRIIATVLLTIKLLIGWGLLIDSGDINDDGASLGLGMIFCIVTVWVI
jgi:hypothetical protein